MKIKRLISFAVYATITSLIPQKGLNSEISLIDGQDTIVITAGQAWEDESDNSLNFQEKFGIKSLNFQLNADLGKMIGDLDNPRKIEAKGSPVEFWLRKNTDSQKIFGEAYFVEYDMENGVINLSGQALVKDERNTIKSEHIIYDTRNKRLISSGQKGVRITAHPK